MGDDQGQVPSADEERDELTSRSQAIDALDTVPDKSGLDKNAQTYDISQGKAEK